MSRRKDALPRAEIQYLDLAEEIMTDGEDRGDRTGTGTRSLFGETMTYDLREEAPILTSKRVALGAVAHELAWMVSGDSNIRYLVENKVGIWNQWPFAAYLERKKIPRPAQDSDEWKALMAEYLGNIKDKDGFAEDFGNLGPVYGHQWRHCPDGKGGEIDQLATVQKDIREDPSANA